MSDGVDPNSASKPAKSTGPLIDPATRLLEVATPEESLEPIAPSLPDRNFFLRLGEVMMFLAAIVGAVAIGLGIATYFTQHTYIAAYLIAYAGFRCADLLVREDYGPDPARDALGRRIADQIPLLILFFAAPFERTYLYGGEAPRWLSALALTLELAGLWVALGARIQLGFFSWEKRDGVEQRVLVQRGFYRFIRHPAIAGIFLAYIAWPIAYGAPLAAILTLAIGAMVVRNSVRREERELIARYGDDYTNYQNESDAIVPNLW